MATADGERSNEGSGLDSTVRGTPEPRDPDTGSLGSSPTSGSAVVNDDDFAHFASAFERVRSEMRKVVVGQDGLVEGLLVAALAGGHVLVEGVPGLGKTLVARAFARVSGTDFKRIQFTPDLMPSDVTGSSIFDRHRGEHGSFTFVPGPVFCQLLLADEINRAPAKTQSALLEAMQDRQVTADGTSRPLPSPFVVVATQNPVESQGTYPLPEAQLDRFLMKLTVAEPTRDAERRIVMNHAMGFDPTDLSGIVAVVSPTELLGMQRIADRVKIDEAVIDYVVDLVRRTREDRAIELGASPRASIAMMRAAKVMAASAGRSFVVPDDVKPIAKSVLRHRIVLHPDAELSGITADERIDEILRIAPVPRAAVPTRHAGGSAGGPTA